MAPVLRILTILLCFLATAPADAAERGVTVTGPAAVPQDAWGTYHALIIGINDYTRWPQLRTAVKDASALSRVLVDRYGFSPGKVILRTDTAATRLQIIRDIRTLAGALTPTDNLLIYFAGHGQLDDLTGDGYWIPVEGAAKDPGTWIANSFVKAVFSSEKVKAKNVVVIADSCYAGAMLRGGPSLMTLDGDYAAKLSKAAARRSRQVISSGGLEPVADGGADGHSLFAYYFINALEENDREVIDLENLFHTRVWKPVTEIGNQRPQVGRLKTPMDREGQFVLFNAGRAADAARRKKAAAAAEKARAEKADHTAALQAERQRLELERQKLEMEKQLLAQKQQLEIEKLKLERQKQAIEMEKMAARMAALKQQAAEAKTPPLAAVSPNVRQPATPAASGETVTAALLPLFCTGHSNAIYMEGRWREGVVKGLQQALSTDQRIDLVAMDRPWAAFAGANVRVYGRPGKFDDIKDSLWKKKSFFTMLPDPVVEAAAAFGKNLRVDVVFMTRSVVDDPSGRGDVYLVDVASKAVYTDGGELSAEGIAGDTAALFQKTIRSYFTDR